ncbi:MAG: fructuronate reductase, partial [Actinomycetota bacterium]|nr:fructuronate reductase [Actinomycetota bacterium]
RYLVTALAAWLSFLAGRDEAGRELPLDDPLAPRLRAVAASCSQDSAALVRAALEIDEVFGRDLRQDTALVDQLTAVHGRVAHDGVRAALAG